MLRSMLKPLNITTAIYRTILSASGMSVIPHRALASPILSFCCLSDRVRVHSGFLRGRGIIMWSIHQKERIKSVCVPKSIVDVGPDMVL